MAWRDFRLHLAEELSSLNEPLLPREIIALVTTYSSPLTLDPPIPRDDILHFTYLLEAAKDGHPWAQAQLSNCYQYGLGVKKNPSEAFEWAKKSASEGEGEGTAALGYCYDKGMGVKKKYF